jgi:hypothetical protein
MGTRCVWWVQGLTIGSCQEVVPTVAYGLALTKIIMQLSAVLEGQLLLKGAQGLGTIRQHDCAAQGLVAIQRHARGLVARRGRQR